MEGKESITVQNNEDLAQTKNNNKIFKIKL